mmetsp:Transcript_114693/g.222755  ORF Transcript_114693/g.222755 Transcript_114693/m.222755 type:complete len:465 (+) Transcript_114693:110-1504(+)
MVCMGLCACFLPIQGQLGFLMSPGLWGLLALPFVACIAVTLTAFYLLTEYAEGPQEKMMEELGWPDWLCVALSYLLIPIEAAMCSLVLFALLFGQVTNQIQEAVLEARGVDRKLIDLCGVDVLTDAGFFTGLCNNILFLLLSLFCMVATFHLHTMPGLGQVLWVASCGWVRPWELVAEKLPLIGYRHCGSQTCHVIRHCFSYVSFGFVAFMLELCPLVNFFTIAGNAYASALLFEGFVDEGYIGPDYLPASNSNNNNNTRGGNPSVYFNVKIGDADAGRIVMELRADVVPAVAENFRCFCTGEKGSGFRGRSFHQVHNFGLACLGGDLTPHNGTGGQSIYGPFTAESYTLKHTRPGVLTLHQYRQSYTLCMVATPWIDTEAFRENYIAFGSVADGMDVVKAIEAVRSRSGRPLKQVIISECGQLCEDGSKGVAAGATCENSPEQTQQQHIHGTTLESAGDVQAG